MQIGDFLCFAGTNLCNKDRLVFLAGNYFFAIFRKYPAPSIDDIFVFVEYYSVRTLCKTSISLYAGLFVYKVN